MGLLLPIKGENFYFLVLDYLRYFVSSRRVLDPETFVLSSLLGVAFVVRGGPTSFTLIFSS